MSVCVPLLGYLFFFADNEINSNSIVSIHNKSKNCGSNVLLSRQHKDPSIG